MAVRKEASGIKRCVLLLCRTFGPSVNLCGFLQFRYLDQAGVIEFRHKRILRAGKPDILFVDAPF